ncbi:LuxR C-terminal-related transcriptional regulator [Streptomyces sp. NPDC012769]|uniref:helix-turn-helix transcriptional regulator n=1 Tax=Streptomyces sp. NPDC012769 TaxID=3364848 RepID=UPI00369653DA
MAFATFTVRPPGAVRPGPLVLLLSPDLRVRGRTPESDACLARLIPPDKGRAPVHAAVYDVAAQLLAREAGVDARPPRAPVPLADGLWRTLRAARIGGRTGGPEEAGESDRQYESPDTESPEDEREIAVTIEETTRPERLDVFGRAYGLSTREREVLGRLAEGADSYAVAAVLFLSEHTVQDHLKSVIAKAGTRSRRWLLARAPGT